MQAPPYLDLLPLSWERMRCDQVAAEYLRRCGVVLPPEMMPAAPDDYQAALTALSTSSPWRRLAEDERARPLDLVVSAGRDGGLHVGVIMLEPRGRVLSSAREVGVYTASLASVADVEGTYRLEEVPAR